MPVSKKHLKLFLTKRPPSTTLLSKWRDDQKYYIVTPLKLDSEKDKCLVMYEDKLESWAPREDLHLQFCSKYSPYATDDDIVCCLCDQGSSESPNEIVICDVCQQGYHQNCYKPRIDISVERWSCQTCQYILGPSSVASGQIISSTPIKVVVEAIEEEHQQDQSIIDETQPVSDEPDQNATPIPSSDESCPLVEQFENGVTIEKMPAKILNVAKALVDKDSNKICTSKFVDDLSNTEEAGGTDEIVVGAEVEIDGSEVAPKPTSRPKAKKTSVATAEVVPARTKVVSTKTKVVPAKTKVALPKPRPVPVVATKTSKKTIMPRAA